MGSQPVLGLTGDVMLGRKVNDRARTRTPDAVWGDTLDRLQSLDGLLVNLECALSTRGERWTRTHRPFHFRADPGWAIPALEAAGVDCAVLANNHLLDFGAVALRETLEALDGGGIAHVGAGENEREAREPAVFRVGGLRVVCIAFTDNTPEYAAGPDSPGVARVASDPDDPDTRRALRDALDRAREVDPNLVVASLHLGPNMVTEPSATIRGLHRWLVGEGVDLVHGHSAHVFQGVEVYEGTPIVHDAGDFVDDYAVDRDLRNDRGFLFEATLDEAGVEQLRLVPVHIADCAVHRADGRIAEWCRETMRERSDHHGTEFERDGEALVVEIPE